MDNERLRRSASGLVVLALLAGASTAAAADRSEPLPAQLEGVGIVERGGESLPLDRTFLDHDGRRVALTELFGKGRPVILTFNYSNCPMLCHIQRDGLLEALAKVRWSVGEEFDVVTISLDPGESPGRAGATRRATLQAYGRPSAEGGWNFLTGREEDIRSVADAAGFGYRFIPERNEYAHAAALVVCTPEGRIARYLYGVKYDPSMVRLSLLEAGEGKVGSSLEQMLLYCFHYDPSGRRYAPAAMNLMRLAAFASAGVLFFYLTGAWLKGRSEYAARLDPVEKAPA